MNEKKQFDLLCESGAISRFRTALKELLIRSELDEKKLHEVTLAVDEALANVARHGYKGEAGRIQVEVADCEDRIEILIRDFGKFFDPTSIPSPELPPSKPGGLGIYFMKTVMDGVVYRRGKKNANELILVKRKQA
ncbi:MAG: ATP-binding protein [Candidatus Omnitrophica bacterium]|nr:ATP-binding protein [Candidatus Omnitrophota bacterium]